MQISVISALHLQQSVPLAPFTTFGIGGPARYFCEITSEATLLEAIQFARREKLEIFVLGGGSNLLISDAGFNGLVLHIAIDASIHTESTTQTIDVTAPAGLDWDTFVLQICQQGISGIECLAGIPGSVGGTPVQNVGAYGQEVAETIHSVRALDLQTLNFVTLPREACGFSYRRSIFNSTQRGRYIVTHVTFRFDPAATPNLTYADLLRFFGDDAHPDPLEVYHAVRTIRHSKGMLLVAGEQDCRSAGSFFKNPIVPATTLTQIAATLQLDPTDIPHWPAPDGLIKLPAGWLLERAGFPKGFTPFPDSPAGISSRHTLALINRGHATASDVIALRDLIRAKVLTQFNIQLDQEPVQLGA